MIRALPAVQPDAAAIREAALREASEIAAQEGWPDSMSDADYRAFAHIGIDDAMDCADRIETAILALIDTGKEVMPLDAGTTETQTQAHDIGPGDQAVAGAAQCCMCGKKGLSTEEDGGPECELSDGRWVCSSDCYDVALGIMLKPVAGAAQPDKINWRDDPDAIVEDDEPQNGRDYA
jgi:hypothetical protein